ncbi:MAG: hypothetical protein VR72_21070 [Clostridiaceae bacterium BRH_c20a]|nr:MAG: hypothetical protein VR72_21070 [Clostridiaceae bacterium BRH_c20a]
MYCVKVPSPDIPTFTDVIIELVNQGFSDITISEIMVNGNNTLPSNVKIAVGRNKPVNASGFHEDALISFHNLNDFNISPKSKLLSFEENREIKEINHYGIRIQHETKIDNVTIYYKYFGISLKKEIQISR